MDKQQAKQELKDEFASLKSLYNLLKTLVAMGLFMWGLVEFKADQYVDGRIDLKLEAAKPDPTEKLSYKLSEKIGCDPDEVDNYIGGMFNTLTGITDTLNDFNDNVLPKLIRLTELTFVGPVVERSHNRYIDFDNEPYRIRDVGTALPYWRDANNVKRDLAGREIR